VGLYRWYSWATGGAVGRLVGLVGESVIILLLAASVDGCVGACKGDSMGDAVPRPAAAASVGAAVGAPVHRSRFPPGAPRPQPWEVLSSHPPPLQE
jgi:hypothetical protein